MTYILQEQAFLFTCNVSEPRNLISVGTSRPNDPTSDSSQYIRTTTSHKPNPTIPFPEPISKPPRQIRIQYLKF